MATQKKLTADDFTNQPQATTAAEVNDQDARTRLWQSLNDTYGQQRKDSAEQYAKAYAQADRQALSRGMQRSSYNNQTLANIAQKGIEANNNIYNAQSADYQNRIGEIERQEKEEEWREREFAANREDAAWSKEFQTNQFEYGKSRDLVADAQWQKEYEEKLRQFNEQMALEKDQWNFQKSQAEAAAAAAAAASSGRSGYTKDDKGKDDNKEGLTDKSFLDSLGKVFDNPSKAVLTSALVNKWPPSAP